MWTEDLRCQYKHLEKKKGPVENPSLKLSKMAHKTCAQTSKNISHAPLCKRKQLVRQSEIQKKRNPCIQTTKSSPPLLSSSPPSAPNRPFQVPEEVAAIPPHLYSYANDLMHIQIINYSESS